MEILNLAWFNRNQACERVIVCDIIENDSRRFDFNCVLSLSISCIE